jgi:hypothetical protein
MRDRDDAAAASEPPVRLMKADDDEQWRVTVVRLVLSVSLLYYLSTLVIIRLARPGLHSLGTPTSVVVLTLLSAFAALSLRRWREPSIIAIAMVALMSIGMLIPMLSNATLMHAMLGGISRWRTDAAVLLTVILNLLPGGAFLIARPLWPQALDVSEESDD